MRGVLRTSSLIVLALALTGCASHPLGEDFDALDAAAKEVRAQNVVRETLADEPGCEVLRVDRRLAVFRWQGVVRVLRFEDLEEARRRAGDGDLHIRIYVRPRSLSAYLSGAGAPLAVAQSPALEIAATREDAARRLEAAAAYLLDLPADTPVPELDFLRLCLLRDTHQIDDAELSRRILYLLSIPDGPPGSGPVPPPPRGRALAAAGLTGR